MLRNEPARLGRLVARIEVLLWKFLRMHWHDIHLFFASVEPIEAMALSRQSFSPGVVFCFFSERQDPMEWENCMTVGLSILFAAMRQAQAQGFDPRTAGIFTLQRMMDLALDSVGDLEELLALGAPP